MKSLNKSKLAPSSLDLGQYPTVLVDGKITVYDDGNNHGPVERIVQLVERESGYAVCFGMQNVLKKHGMDIRIHAEQARQYLEYLFREASKRFDTRRAGMPAIHYDRIAAMDADGYNVNRSFTPNDNHTATREFITTKCVHFDSATPFIANIYGPNENISGGYPVICDTRKFCEDHGIPAAQIVENIPNNYNVAVKAQFAQLILANYSQVIEHELNENMLMIVLFNEINGGLAHAATPPYLTNASQPGKRPIRHLEYQFAELNSLAHWYSFYGLNQVAAPGGLAQNVARYHHGVGVGQNQPEQPRSIHTTA